MSRPVSAPFLALALGLAFGAAFNAGATPGAPGFGRTKVAPYRAGEPTIVHGRLGFVTLVEFEPGERIEAMALGDGAAWQAQPGKDGTVLFLKPLALGGQTNLMVLTNRRTYGLLLDASAKAASPAFRLRFAVDAAEPGGPMAEAVSQPAGKTVREVRPSSAKTTAPIRSEPKPARAAPPVDGDSAKPLMKMAIATPPPEGSPPLTLYVDATARASVAQRRKTGRKGSPGPVSVVAADAPAPVSPVLRDDALRSFAGPAAPMRSRSSAPSAQTPSVKASEAHQPERALRGAPAPAAAAPETAKPAAPIWNGTYAVSGPRRARPQSVLDDGRFTYFGLRSQDGPPVIHALEADGRAVLVEARMRGPYWVALRLAPRWRFTRGADVVEIVNVRWGLDEAALAPPQALGFGDTTPAVEKGAAP